MKDPAALVYIDTWLSSTAEMDADCRGWYFNLILHQYDKESLPNDIEKLAQLAVVKFSQFERFKQVFEQVLKEKFEVCEDGRIRNKKASDIIRGRKKFTEKRSKSGSVGFIVKIANELGFSDSEKHKLKTDLYSDKLTIEEAKDKQVLKQMLELYRNVDEDEDIDRKEDSSKERKKGRSNPNAPTEKEVIEYVVGCGYSQSLAEKFYARYTVSGWVVKDGSPIENWKGLLHNAWFNKVQKSNVKAPALDPGWVYVDMNKAYGIVRETYNVKLSEKEKIGAGDDYVREMMNIHPAFESEGDGWKYRQS